MSKNRILFNPVSPVHYRNMECFKDLEKDWDFTIIVNPCFPWFRKKDFLYKHFYFRHNRVPDEAFENVKAVVVFTAQQRIPACHLIQEAAFRSIPVIAVEEVYQMMFEQGYVNEYFVPVDKFLVASDFERTKFLESGIDEKALEVTGYLFGKKNGFKVEEVEKKRIRESLKIKDSSKVALLSLACLTKIFETEKVRRTILDTVTKGLDERYKLIIKPHPAEEVKNIDMIKRLAPEAIIADKNLSIKELLSISDVLFNRGNSNVVAEAISMDKPVILVPAGRETLFHGFMDKVIVKDSSEVSYLLKNLKNIDINEYKDVLKKYIGGIDQKKAHLDTIARIQEIIETNECRDRESRLLKIGLLWGWMGCSQEGLRTILKLDNINEDLRSSIYKLISFTAVKEDLDTIKEVFGSGYMKWIVQSLWIKALYIKDRKILRGDMDWLTDFPPRMNREAFLHYIFMFIWISFRSGFEKEASSLFRNIHDEYSGFKQIDRLLKICDKKKDLMFNIRYLNQKVRYMAYYSIKNILFKLEDRIVQI